MQNKKNSTALIRKRNDRTKEIPAEHRRLDTLAKIASGDSTCFAVTIIKEKLYISANEFHNNMQSTNGKVTLAKNVIDYFSNILKNDNPIPKKVAAMFEELCLPQIPNMCGTGVSVMLTEQQRKKIIGDVYNQEDPTISQLQEFYGKSNASQAGQIFPKIKSVHKKFLKLGESCQPGSENKIGWKNHEILIREIKPGKGASVHAEMQQLSMIIDSVNIKRINPDEEMKIYIGISKLCCLQCRTMVDAANEILAKEGIKITLETRGHHDRTFPGWTCPTLFQDGYSGNNINKTSLQYKISCLGHQKYQEIINKYTQQPRGDMSPSQSDSEPNSYLDPRLAQNLTFLSDSLSIMKSINEQFPEITKQGIQDMYSTANLIGHSEDLKTFLSGINNGTIDGLEETNAIFEDFYEQSLAKSYSISKEQLLFILTNPAFLSENVCKHFYSLNSNANQTTMQEEKTHGLLFGVDGNINTAVLSQKISKASDSSIVANQSNTNFLALLSESNSDITEESKNITSFLGTSNTSSRMQKETYLTESQHQGSVKHAEEEQPQSRKRKAEDDGINPNQFKKSTIDPGFKLGGDQSDEKALFLPNKSSSDVINKSRGSTSIISSTTLMFDASKRENSPKIRLNLSKSKLTTTTQSKSNTVRTENKTKDPGL